MDFHERTGEYVAVLLPAAWEGMRPALTAALDGLAAEVAAVGLTCRPGDPAAGVQVITR